MTDIDLSGFTGSTTWYRHPLFRDFTYTDGVQYLAEKAGAYWLIDAIFSHQVSAKARAEEFQVWKLERHGSNGALLIMTDGNTDKPIIRQDIEYTDFPLPKMELWFENQVLYLPSER